jgi:hypothetical protein
VKSERKSGLKAIILKKEKQAYLSDGLKEIIGIYSLSRMRKVYSIQGETRPPLAQLGYFWGIVTYTLPIEGWGVWYIEIPRMCPVQASRDYFRVRQD